MIRELMVNGAKNIPANYAAKVDMVTGMGVRVDHKAGQVKFPDAATAEGIEMVAHEFIPEGIYASQTKLNQLDSAFQKFRTDLMKSDIPKFFVSLATVFVDGADSAVKFAGALPTLTAAISGVLSVMQMSGKLKNGAGKVNMPSYVCCV